MESEMDIKKLKTFPDYKHFDVFKNIFVIFESTLFLELQQIIKFTFSKIWYYKIEKIADFALKSYEIKEWYLKTENVSGL